MIVLDTNVISELMRKKPEPSVLRWTDNQDPQTVFTSAITAAELLSGLEQLPAGKTRNELGHRMHITLEEGFRGRVLPFDDSCAMHYARIFARRRAIGRKMGVLDAMIAAVSSRHNFKIATRDIEGFSGCGLTVINPWTD